MDWEKISIYIFMRGFQFMNFPLLPLVKASLNPRYGWIICLIMLPIVILYNALIVAQILWVIWFFGILPAIFIEGAFNVIIYIIKKIVRK